MEISAAFPSNNEWLFPMFCSVHSRYFIIMRRMSLILFSAAARDEYLPTNLDLVLKFSWELSN